MKCILATLLVLSSSMTFARHSNITSMLSTPEVERYDAEMEAKGFSLSKIKDKYQDSGVFPRCPCKAYELTYVSFTEGKKKSKNVPVVVTGFGNKETVQIGE